jgi:hypothetical protein
MQETMDLKGGRVLVKGEEVLVKVLQEEFWVEVGVGCFKAR